MTKTLFFGTLAIALLVAAIVVLQPTGARSEDAIITNRSAGG